MSVRRDGASVPVELSDDLTHATIAGRTVAVRLVADRGSRVELEIDGEPVVVAGWPSACARPPNAVEVNGESWPVEFDLAGATAGSPPGVREVAPAVTPATPNPEGSVASADGVAVVPPMPGRVVEVRVKEGDRVERGAVLLVLEAMKMRNEVAAPAAGVVRRLRVTDGSNVRAREPMLFVAPA